jgi:hypothetical protein
MKKLVENKPAYGLSVKFAEGFEYNDDDGRIVQIFLKSRNTSVPIIISAVGSEAKKNGQDGIFALCSDKCGEKMKNAIKVELKFDSMGFIDLE